LHHGNAGECKEGHIDLAGLIFTYVSMLRADMPINNTIGMNDPDKLILMKRHGIFNDIRKGRHLRKTFVSLHRMLIQPNGNELMDTV